ncbi:hypothetical protein [Vulcaniibacterium tengchongense]|uniref:Secreted protein n=1 Tax=Vulcaniibacterium tengchongense TaxID=1273429 RepID=A0A3N4V9L4_9GAMM|nr:hypothetical protein [Vulcaniibacterium tengchongense]RPE79672.1 hypothetical protein EDC50_1496 [Vulcaniibacterium tengchongense]
MLRICLSLLIAIASATVVAGEVKRSSPNGDGCADAANERAGARSDADHASGGARPSKSGKPSLSGDGGGNRLQSPRWHSFLPGMFR